MNLCIHPWLRLYPSSLSLLHVYLYCTSVSLSDCLLTINDKRIPQDIIKFVLFQTTEYFLEHSTVCAPLITIAIKLEWNASFSTCLRIKRRIGKGLFILLRNMTRLDQGRVKSLKYWILKTNIRLMRDVR